MKKNLKNTLLVLIIFLIVPYFFNSAFAAYLKFDNTAVTVANGGSFQISVMIEPGSDALNGTDIYVTYDSTLLKVTTVSDGSLFPYFFNDITTVGKIYIAGTTTDPASSISTSGTVAMITFQALKEGSSTLSFDCNSSKIIKDDVNATNVIACSQNTGATVTIGVGGQTAVPTDAPSQLPQSGVFDNVAKIAVPGMLLLFIGGIFRLLL